MSTPLPLLGDATATLSTGAGVGESLVRGPVSDPARPTVETVPMAARAVTGVDAAYLHVPFCRHKCHYCDFYSFVDRDDRQGAFVSRLIEEIGAAAAGWRRPLRTIFVGGGTPTLLSPALWRTLLRSIRTSLPLVSGGEFTVEANPETVTAELATTLVDGGVTRVSLGAQSFDRRHLRTLERHHDPDSVPRSVALLRAVGIREISLDLIFGVPGQTVDEWQRDLEAALALRPDHVSCYGLMYEPNTALTARWRAGEFDRLDDEIEAEMYLATVDRLAVAGFEHYEISNWARRDSLGARRCRHNMIYWRGGDWWAFGPSAAGHVSGVRWRNVPRLGDWLTVGPWSPVVDVELADARTRSGEAVMLGLRLLEGLDEALVDALLSVGDDAEARHRSLARHVESGLLDRRDGRIRLSRNGLLLADGVLGDLV